MSIHLGNWQQVLNYYNKAEASLDMSEVCGSRIMLSKVGSIVLEIFVFFVDQ